MQQGGPFAAALAEAPCLKVLRTIKPTLLNAFYLDVAENPKLERIELTDQNVETPELRVVETRQTKKQDPNEERMLLEEATKRVEEMPSTLFSSQIAAYPRLNTLVRAGYFHVNYNCLRRAKSGQQ